MLKKLVSTAAFAMVLGVTGHAEATIIDSASYTAAGCLGATNCVVQGATLTAGPAGATFIEQNFGGARGLGINFINTGQPRDPEIQGDGGSVEVVTIGLGGQIVREIRLAQFYNPVHFPGEPQEIAQIFHDAVLATLQSLNNSGGFNQVGFDPGATFTQVDVTAGLWSILNPFGSNLVTTLAFRAANTPTATDNSDYSIALVQTVPEPTTLGLLGIGLVSLGIAARRRRRSEQ